MPLLPDDNEGCSLAETGRDPQEYKGRESRVSPKSGNYRPGAPSAKRPAFQSILRNTTHCQVDVVVNQEALQTLFGCEVHFALCAYRPKFERIPSEAHCQNLHRAVATQVGSSEPDVSAWEERPVGKHRSTFDHAGACIFAFRRPPASACARKQQPKPDSVEESLKSPNSPADLKDRTLNNLATPQDETLQTTKAQHCPSGDELSEASESELDWGAASPRGVAGSDLVAF